MENFVKLSRSLAKAVENQLFDKSGVDMSPIINDLSVNRDRDVVALSVGVLLKGFVKDEFTGKVRYHAYYTKRDNCRMINYYKHECTGFSLIDNKVTLKVTKFEAEADGRDENGNYSYGEFKPEDDGTKTMEPYEFLNELETEQEAIDKCLND